MNPGWVSAKVEHCAFSAEFMTNLSAVIRFVCFRNAEEGNGCQYDKASLYSDTEFNRMKFCSTPGILNARPFSYCSKLRAKTINFTNSHWNDIFTQGAVKDNSVSRGTLPRRTGWYLFLEVRRKWLIIRDSLEIDAVCSQASFPVSGSIFVEFNRISASFVIRTQF